MSESYTPLIVFFILASIAVVAGIYAYFNVPMFTEIVSSTIGYFNSGIDAIKNLY